MTIAATPFIAKSNRPHTRYEDGTNVRRRRRAEPESRVYRPSEDAEEIEL